MAIDQKSSQSHLNSHTSLTPKTPFLLKIISKITKMIVVMTAIDDNGECCEAWLGNKSLL